MSDGVISISDSSSGAAETRAPRNIAHPAFADIGLKLKACNDTLGELQLLGIDHATLPELVLVGDQSSGKSSLMSALAQLDLPTSSGICTRCPFHIHMSSSKDTHLPPKQSDVKKSNPFPPWVPKQVTDVKLFKTIYENDSVDVDEVLRWAQIATLNPSTDFRQYVPGEGSYARETGIDFARGETETKFSPNLIALEMKGPGFPDLSFYDLPGVFAVASNRNENYLVSVVENLTRRYVSRPEAKIMLALPMSNDIETSRTFRIIRDLDAEDRTIGVITKADKADWNTNAKVSDWAAVFTGEKHAVEKGFFITSLPPEAGDNWEDVFFRHGTSSWPRAFDAFAVRCGVDHLRRFITKELGDSFSDSLPDIKLKVENRLEEIELELNELPELPQNVEYEVRTSLKNFHASVKIAMNSPEFEGRFKELNQKFHNCLIRMRPGCTCDTPKRKEEPVVIIDDDSEHENVGSKRPSRNASIQCTPKKPRTQGLPVTPIKKEEPRLGSIMPSPASVRPAQMLRDRTVSFRGGEFRGVQLHLTDIRDEIASATRPGFGAVVPLEIHETLSLRAISRWNGPLNVYIQQTITLLMEAVADALRTTFENLRHRLICKYLTTQQSIHIFTPDPSFYMDEGKIQGKRLEDLLSNETYRVSTRNESGMEQSKAIEKKALERYRLFARATAEGLFDTQDRRFTNDHYKLMREKKPTSEAEKEWARTLPGDTFSREIDIVATVIGYCTSFAIQINDLHVSSSQTRGCEEKLGLSSYPTRRIYERLMDENEEIACRRDRLKREKDKLKMAAQRILALEGSCSSSSYTIPYYNQQSPENDAPTGKLEEQSY
ncbi:P-loop containing nucleoside triphosphate hydrolase protein [Xylariaceae sp. FL1272]|nr:P-loop containing nucleoside triphosphate hydrolase protein [Xylariaceae sp. FL1272]